MILTLLLGAAGAGLLLAGLPLARLLAVKGRDPIATGRILQALGALLLIGALLASPYHRETRAVPPGPNAPTADDR